MSRLETASELLTVDVRRLSAHLLTLPTWSGQVRMQDGAMFLASMDKETLRIAYRSRTRIHDVRLDRAPPCILCRHCQTRRGKVMLMDEGVRCIGCAPPDYRRGTPLLLSLTPPARTIARVTHLSNLPNAA